jgi:hypothetical protein
MEVTFETFATLNRVCPPIREERAADVNDARIHGQRLDEVVGAAGRIPRLQRTRGRVDRSDKIARDAAHHR